MKINSAKFVPGLVLRTGSTKVCSTQTPFLFGKLYYSTTLSRARTPCLSRARSRSRARSLSRLLAFFRACSPLSLQSNTRSSAEKKMQLDSARVSLSLSHPTPPLSLSRACALTLSFSISLSVPRLTLSLSLTRTPLSLWVVCVCVYTRM